MVDADSLHRLAKILVDSSEAATFEEALQTFSRYGVRIVFGARARSDPGAQIIALTAINAAARSFQGNVAVEAPDMELVAPGFEVQSLSQFLEWLGIEGNVREGSGDWPTIYIGDLNDHHAPMRSIRAWADGWSFGLGGNRFCSQPFFAPACVAAGGLAVSEAFSLLRRDNPYAGRRSVAMSLWSLNCASPQLGNPPAELPPVPSAWLIGLGHLGQAYAWTLGFMQPETGIRLYLQDIDSVTKSTLSTSLLSVAADLDHMKTRVVARWLEARGYKTAIVERRFDEFQKVGLTEPRLALFGVDNTAARRVMEGVGFRLAIDAGLGSGYKDFRAIRMRTFPGPSQAAVIWPGFDHEANSNTRAPAYEALLAQGAEPCGVTTLATRAVGAPFVGCVAAALVVSEMIRREGGGPAYGYVDLNLRDPQACDAEFSSQEPVTSLVGISG